MCTPRLYVDFNEMVSHDEVLLSQTDTKSDSFGNMVTLVEGMHLWVYSDDTDSSGRRDNLIAEGLVVRNHHGGWTSAAKWSLRINERGIHHESDDRPPSRSDV